MNTTIVNRSVRSLTCMGAAALVTLGLFSPTFAADGFTQTTSIIVKYGELDLGKPEGVLELYRRINKAADRACGGIPTGHSFWYKQQYRQCKEVAVADAVRKVNNGGLTAYHQGSMDKAGRSG